MLTRSLFPLLICCLLMACQSLKQENAEDLKKVKSWEGQDIHVAIDALGPPERTTTGTKGHAYYWSRSREVNTAIYTNGLPVNNGQRLSYDPNSPGFNKTITCRMRITTDPDNVILHYRYKGPSLACELFAKDVTAAPDEAPGSSSDVDEPVITDKSDK